jgi:uncharacterized protein
VTPGEVIATYLAAAKRDDWDAAYGFFADDILISIPGDSAFAGEHRGRDAAIRYIRSIRDHYRGGTIELELVDMLTSDERAALIVRERFSLGSGPPAEIRRANVYRVRDDRIVEISIFEADQYAVDALLHDITVVDDC